MRRWWLWAVLLGPASMLCSAACSSSSSGGSTGGAACGDAPCGGDSIGTWGGAKACASGSQSVAITGCAPATVTLNSETLSGTAHFDAGGTWQTAFSIDYSAHVVMAQGCMTESQCTGFEAQLKTQTGVTGATCSFQKTCACDYGGTTPNNQTGSYQIKGTSVTLTTDGSPNPPETDGYCVSGSSLTITSNASGPSVSLVFNRQN